MNDGSAPIGTPYEPAHVRHLLAAAVPGIESAGEAQVELAGRRFTIRRQLLDNIGSSNNRDAIGNLRKALLIFHSARDTTVSIDNAAQIFMAAKHPKSFVSLDNADHLLSRREDAEYVAAVLSAWAARYIDAPPMEAQHVAPGDPGAVTVTGLPGTKVVPRYQGSRHQAGLMPEQPAVNFQRPANPSCLV